MNGAVPHRAAPGPVLLAAPASSYRIAPYLDAARRVGVPMMVVSEGEHALLPAGSEGVRVSFARLDEALATVLRAVEAGTVSAVLASDDGTVEFASRLAAALGLPHNPPASARVSRRKDLARAAQREAGLPVPAFRRVQIGVPLRPQLLGVRYPAVVKPLAMSGSRGVVRADDEASLLSAVERVGRITVEAEDGFEREHLLVEDFLPGKEVALEGMLDAGRLEVLAIFDKPDPLDGPFFEETYYVTPSRLPAALQARAAERVAQCCAAYGLVRGPVHAELRIHEDEAWLLEVAARTIGGECARLLTFGSGCGLEELVLRQALGQPVTASTAAGCAGVLMLPTPRKGVLRRVEGVIRAQQVPGIETVSIAVREGHVLVPLPEGASYLGFVFARGETSASVEAALREAHACLRVVTAPLLPVAAGLHA